MATITASATGGNWNVVTTWTGAVVPTSADDVILASTSGNVTIPAGVSAACRSLDASAYTHTLSWSNSSTAFLLVGDASGGDCNFGTGMTLTGFSGVSNGLQLVSSSSNGGAGWAFTTSGKQLPATTFGGVAGVTGGKWVFQDDVAVTASGSGVFRLNGGTLDTNGKSLTFWKFNCTGSVVRTLTLGSSSITATGPTPGWDCTSSANLTVTANTATLTMNGAIAGGVATSFIGGSKNWNGLTLVLANPGTATITSATLAAVVCTAPQTSALIFTGTNTITTLTVAPNVSVTLPSSTTTTIGSVIGPGQNNGYLFLPGTATATGASTPNASALQITSDIDLRCRVALSDWTPATVQALVSKNNSGSLRSYTMGVAIGGALTLTLSPDGTANNQAVSTVSPTTLVSDGDTLWVRATWRQSDGKVQFFTADGSLTNPIATDFTQLGTDRTTQAGTAIANTASTVEVGIRGAGTTEQAAGNFYRAQIRNGIDGTVVFDADFANKNFGDNTFAESSSNGATVTLNGFAAVGDGRISLQSSVSGTAATLSKAASIFSSGYLKIKDITATGGATWYAGSTSVDATGNTGWLFVNYAEAAAVLNAPAVLSGDGTASAGSTTYTGAVDLAAPAAITVAGDRITEGGLSLAAPVALSADAVRTTTVGASLSAPLVISTGATRTTTGTVALNAPPSLSALVVVVQSASVIMTAPAVLVGAGLPTAYAAASLSAPLSLSVNVQATVFAYVQMLARVGISVDAGRLTQAALDLLGPLLLTADPVSFPAEQHIYARAHGGISSSSAIGKDTAVLSAVGGSSSATGKGGTL